MWRGTQGRALAVRIERRAWELLRWCCNPFPARRAMALSRVIHFLPTREWIRKSFTVASLLSSSLFPSDFSALHARGEPLSVDAPPTDLNITTTKQHRHPLSATRRVHGSNNTKHPIPSSPPISSRPTGGSALASPGHNARSHSNTSIC
jgi:hypothetical protein